MYLFKRLSMALLLTTVTAKNEPYKAGVRTQRISFDTQQHSPEGADSSLRHVPEKGNVKHMTSSMLNEAGERLLETHFGKDLTKLEKDEEKKKPKD